MAVVYRHRRLDNMQPFYIGIGRNESRAYNKINRSDFWKKIVQKCNYYIEILYNNISYKDAKELEMFLISEYGRIDNGTGILCNLTDGGEGSVNYIHSEDIKAKMSEYKKGRTTWMKGKKHSEESKLKMSKANIGNKFAKGYKHSEETKSKLSELGKGNTNAKGTRSKESIKKMSDAAKKAWIKRKNIKNE